MSSAVLNLAEPTVKSELIRRIQQLSGLFRVDVVKYRKRRSDAQNKLLWGWVYPHVAAGILEAWGENLTGDEVHILMKRKFLSRPIVNQNTGEEMDRAFVTTTKLTTEEFSQYVENIAKFAAESLSVVIPPTTLE